MRHGVPFATTPGVLLMPLWHADHWDSQDSVKDTQIQFYCSIILHVLLYKQELKLYQQPFLDRELDPFSLMMLDVLVMKPISWTAQL